MRTSGAFVLGAITGAVVVWFWRQEFGLPGRPQARGRRAKPERMVFESQAAYLRRLDLLIPGEVERIPAEALEPEIVGILELPALERIAPALASRNGAAGRMTMRRLG